MTKFHDDLQIHIFDGFLTDASEIQGYEKRIKEIQKRIIDSGVWNNIHFRFQNQFEAKDKEDLERIYSLALEKGYEGLVLTHKDHKYKFGRNTLKEGTLLKMKDDSIEYDAVVIDVAEASSVKEGTEKTTNNLGRSVTSKKIGDREASGIAKGFKVAYLTEDGTCLGIFTVCLRGYTNEERKDLFTNKAKYIGKHFVYTGMKPVKDFPRHAYFSHWRDTK